MFKKFLPKKAKKKETVLKNLIYWLVYMCVVRCSVVTVDTGMKANVTDLITSTEPSILAVKLTEQKRVMTPSYLLLMSSQMHKHRSIVTNRNFRTLYILE